MSIDHKQKVIIFWSINVITILAGLIYVYFIQSSATLNILPVILQTKNHVTPLRSSDVFVEDLTKNASVAKVIYHADSAFTFKYKKSTKQQHAFAGVWFPLENLDIHFNEYDAIVVGIEASHKTKRIPLNFTVQNKIKTHQYIRCFIEIEPTKKVYTLPFNTFFTPTSWYERNKISQVNLPLPDFSKINTMSFESCGILDSDIEDQYTITTLRLTKNNDLKYAITVGIVCLSIGIYTLYFFNFFSKNKEKSDEKIIHVPIDPIEYEYEEKIEDEILRFLAKNYINPNLTLSDLTKEFGKNSREISAIIKEMTKMSFPKYINFLRIEEAKRILQTKKIQNISEIGYIVGFNSPSNFNRVFKEKEGISPKEFMNNS